MGAVLLCSSHGSLHVADIVQCVEDTDDIDTVLDSSLDECIDNVVSVVLVAEQVLTAEKHLKGRVGHVLLENTETFPRIFRQETHAGVERSAAPAFQRPVTDLVEVMQSREHILQSHTRSSLGLVRVAEDRICDKKLVSHL